MTAPAFPTLTHAADAARAIAHVHAALRIERDADPTAQPADPSVRAVAFAAARQLGFVPADAQCVADAWARRCQTRPFDPSDWPDEPTDFGWHTPVARFAPCPKELGLYAVLPDATWVERMAAAGVPTLQLRVKDDDGQRIRAQIRAAVQAVQGTGARLFINDHWRAALEEGAYGVHLGQEDLDTLTAADLDTLRTAGVRLGISTHGYAEMARAWALGPSYVALGAVFPTTLKAMPTAPQGPARLARYARLLQGLPTVAIGGIGLPELPTIAACGVGSFAVVRAITGAPDPQSAAATLMTTWARLRAAEATPSAVL